MRYVAAFRTYSWNPTVEELARRFFAACPSARQVVLADETRGPLGITGHEVISHTQDCSALGLAAHPPGQSLWFNVDYGAYVLRAALPGYPLYLLSESDLAVNCPLEPMVAAAAAEGIDLVAHQVRPAWPTWHWHRNAAAVFAEPWAALLFFMLLSGRALDTLLAARQAQARAFAEGRLAEWPFCEGFVPSVLREAGLRFEEVSRFADTRWLRYRPRVAIDDPRAGRRGTLVHSVVHRAQIEREAVELAARRARRAAREARAAEA